MSSASLWANFQTLSDASPEDKQGMARNPFDVAYDLATRRLTDFRLKPWADRFLILRASLYDLESGDSGEEK